MKFHRLPLKLLFALAICSVACLHGADLWSQIAPVPVPATASDAAGAQPGAASPNANPAGGTATAKQGDVLLLTGAACYKRNPDSSGSMLPDDCGLNKNIVLTFDNLKEWSKSGASHNPASLVLILNGKMLKGIVPSLSPMGDGNQLEFALTRLDLVDGDQDSKDNRAAWNAMMSNALLRQYVKVGVILNSNPPSVFNNPVIFRILPPYWPGVAIFMGLLVLIFLILARESDILRDGSVPVAAPTPWWKFGIGSGPKTSYSLARCQMAWWFFIILASFLYIWMIFLDTETLTSGALILMGISAATGFSSFIVDSSKQDSRKALTGEQSDLTTQLSDLAAALAAVAPPDPNLISQLQQKQARLTQVNKDLASLPAPFGKSDGFLNDILRDETGVSFHRFQMAAWTIVLGFVFVIAVYQKLAMPDFSPTLLGLVGISSGTYVGFKIPNQAK